MSARRLLGAWCVLLAAATPANARELHSLWEIDTVHNTVYLLGSVHMLRESDYPLAAPIDAAYADAEVLVMELDMDDLDPIEFQLELMQKSMLPADESLRSVLGEAVYRDAEQKADELDVRLEMLSRVEPWFAALTITNLQMVKLGYTAATGIEGHFQARAARDGKEIRGLETVAEQLDIFDSMPGTVQRELLLKTLDDALEAEVTMQALVGAWKRGDTRELERELLEGFADIPGLYEQLLVQRNRSWVRQIEDLIGQDRDYLIIVGAMHLVGEDSVVALLRRRGYGVLQR